MRRIVAGVSLVIIAATALAFAMQPQAAVGTPNFKEISSATMKLQYGFNGASVYDNAKKAWFFIPMTTITRSAVRGHVNQINNQFALAAGLHSIAVYDYSKHQWFEKKPAGADDSTDSLSKNFVLTSTQVKVRILNGPFAVYSSATGWSEVSPR